MIYELVLRNFNCSLEFVFSLLLLQPFNFSEKYQCRNDLYTVGQLTGGDDMMLEVMCSSTIQRLFALCRFLV